MVKLFKFPSFENWDAHKREFKETIGEFTCVFHPTMWHINSSITRYECAIASCDNPTNIYVQPVVSWAFDCDSTNTELVKSMYNRAVREVHSRWINYIESNYMVSNGGFCPEYISLRSILIAAICTSNKKEFSVDEINQLLGALNQKAYNSDQYKIFVELPDKVDIGYLEQIVCREYSAFRICRDYEGIRLTNDVNASQLYYKWEIKSTAILDIIKDFYHPDFNNGWC